MVSVYFKDATLFQTYQNWCYNVLILKVAVLRLFTWHIYLYSLQCVLLYRVATGNCFLFLSGTSISKQKILTHTLSIFGTEIYFKLYNT